MAWRFTPSKFKNTTPTTPKRDGTIYDLPIGNLSCTNNAIHSNAHLLAFLIDGEGGKIGLLPVGARGRRLRNDLNILCAHSDAIADFCFTRFDNFLVSCTGSGEKLKVWSCDSIIYSEEVVVTSESRASIEIGDDGVRMILDCLAPHKAARNLLGVGLGANGPVVVDLETERVAVALESDKIDRSLSLDWSECGSLLAVSTDKGRRAFIFDPRASKSSIHNVTLHAGIGRENRVLFADGNLVSSGFTANRAQEILLYDSRDWSAPVQNEVFDGSTGLLLPLYDADSKLLFLAGKGACKIFLSELKFSTTSSDKVSLNRLCEHSLKDQTLGACLLPKTTCDVMSGEVQRIHQLVKSAIIPIPCIVPRRSYQQFHSDLFPDTVGGTAGCEAQQWLSGSNELPPKMKLGPLSGEIGEVSKVSSVINCKPSAIAAAEGNLKKRKASVHYQDVFVRNEDTLKEEACNGNASNENVCNEDTSNEVVQKKNTRNWEITKESISIENESNKDVRNGSDNAQKNNGTMADNKLNKDDVNDEKASATIVEDISDKENVKKSENETSLLKPQKAEMPVVRLRLSALPTTDPNIRSTVIGDHGAASVTGIHRARPKSCVIGTIQSKFRHVEVIAGANKSVFTNLRNVNNRLPTESDGFCISLKYAALPLSGTAGIISILELVVPMKVPDGIVDGLQNRSQVMDLQWNPFRADELSVALENGVINVWRVDAGIPCIGSTEFAQILQKEKEEENSTQEYQKLSNLEPYRVLSMEEQVRVTHVRYHPTVKDLLAVGLLNGSIQLWNIADGICLHKIKGHSQGILSLAWSADGRRLASVGRDAFLKVYEPLLGADCCVAEARVLEGTRAARVLFVCEDSLILLVGFSKSSARQCALFRINDETNSGNLQTLHVETIDVSTQPLVPYYDYDTSVVFLTGKGDRTIQMFEVCAEAPYFLRLTPTTFAAGHQSIALYQKNACDVRDVEFACGWRLTEKIIEKLSFKVPRVKKELFQRDVFPHALVSWEPTSSAAEWLDGVLHQPKFVDLRPEGMQEIGKVNS